MFSPDSSTCHCTYCKIGARIKGLPSDLAGHDRSCTQKHVFELLAEAPLLFSGASPAPAEVLPGAFGICDENHTASVELCAQVPSGALHRNHPIELLAREEDHVNGSYQNRRNRPPICCSFAFVCRGCCHTSIIRGCCITHCVFPISVTVVRPRSPQRS